MARFRYRAMRQAGGEIAGELVAADALEAASQLQAEGSFPIEIAPAPASAGQAVLRRQGARLSSRELTLFIRQFAALASAGIAIDRALVLIAADRARSGRRALAARLLEAVNRGESLSEACAEDPAFARHHAMMIAAGEARGNVGAALERLAAILERNRAIAQSLAGALIYPASVLVVAFLSIAFLLGFVAPRFENLVTGFRHEPPPAMQALLAASWLFQNFALPALLVVAVAVALFLVRRRDPGFRLAVDRRILRLPFAGPLLAKTETERLAFLLGNLVEAGVELPGALAASREASFNEALRQGLAAAERGVLRGDGVTAALAESRVLPELALELVRVGEETGDLAPMFLKASDLLRKEVEATTTELIGLIAPVSLLVLGLLIGAIALTIFSAVMEVYDIAW
jgi:general secretion pathway protein F